MKFALGKNKPPWGESTLKHYVQNPYDDVFEIGLIYEYLNSIKLTFFFGFPFEQKKNVTSI